MPELKIYHEWLSCNVFNYNNSKPDFSGYLTIK